MNRFRLASLTLGAALLVAACSEPPAPAPPAPAVDAGYATNPDVVQISPNLQWLAYRLRSDNSAGLNADSGWAAPENSGATLTLDQPFRLRVQVQASSVDTYGHLLGLQYRVEGGEWQPMGLARFPYPDYATPMVSVITTESYLHGDETERLLGGPDIAWDDGFGLNGHPWTPVWRVTGEALEWEWPIVARRFYDGPGFAEDDTQVEIRLVDGLGRIVEGQMPVNLTFSAKPGHLGGTFVETPGRLGPYQAANGDLFFFIEPSETDNRFMAVVSHDGGNSWREVDGANRPDADDLEGVATARLGDVIHIIHQQSEEVFYHAFEMGSPGRWLVNSESMATPAEPPTQFADVATRSDGSVVAFYAGDRKLFLQIRSPAGVWQSPLEIDVTVAPDLSGPVMVAAEDDVITLAYTGRDGRGFIRHLLPDGSLTERQLLATELGSLDSENGAIAPMVVLPTSGDTVLVYRHSDGLLHERRFTRDGALSAPVQVSAIPVVTDAVDAEQVGADLIYHNGILHLLFIDDASRSIYYTTRAADSDDGWSTPEILVGDIDAGWVRGSVHQNPQGQTVYGVVYDAGSQGGSGFNTYLAIPLN